MRYNCRVSKSGEIVYFLLVFDVKLNKLTDASDQFDDVDLALARYAEAEQEYLGRGFEVVLVGAESIETVMMTHGAYFDQSSASTPRAGLSITLS